MNPLLGILLLSGASGGRQQPAPESEPVAPPGRTTVSPEIGALPSSAPPEGKPWAGPQIFANGHPMRLVFVPGVGYRMQWPTPNGWQPAALSSDRAQLAIRAGVRTAMGSNPGPGESVEFPDSGKAPPETAPAPPEAPLADSLPTEPDAA